MKNEAKTRPLTSAVKPRPPQPPEVSNDITPRHSASALTVHHEEVFCSFAVAYPRRRDPNASPTRSPTTPAQSFVLVPRIEGGYVTVSVKNSKHRKDTMPARAPEPERLQGNSITDDIVITGISGRLPESNSIEEFKQHLFDGVDLVTDDERRWPSALYGLPTRTGKLKDLQYFDATFFGVHAKQAHVMDPQLRILLELTHEALVDAGVNPGEMKGSKTGVFIGVSDSESSEFWTQDPDQVNGYGLTGCCRAMFPNRISYTFDFTGPSYAIDTACSSSLFAFQQAVTAIKTGQCDSAIVGGVNLLLKPTSSLQFHRLSMLSPQGMCKAFDASGNGYVRSEGAVVVLLQKASAARRVYGPGENEHRR
ncbi:hypothetical protein JTB14_012233 [Gonioctena quinquepunctata]|nr:hypothetical protein JTB14_012233 [Gonioctena quinquepunctata]